VRRKPKMQNGSQLLLMWQKLPHCCPFSAWLSFNWGGSNFSGSLFSLVAVRTGAARWNLWK
jgi:hypothetical protein